MIATANAKDTVGCVSQECINASFMSLDRYIDTYEPSLNKQPYNVICYEGMISSDTVLCCCPPSRETPVYGTPGNGSLYKIGTMDTNGVVRFCPLTCICEAVQCSYSWADSCSCSISAGYSCASSLAEWASPFYAWNDPVDVCTATYRYYRPNCCVASDVDGCPIYNYSCVGSCPLTSGYTYGDDGSYVYRKMCRVDSVEQWLDYPENGSLYNATCEGLVKRCDAGDRCVLMTTCYTNLCEWKDINGCTVCSALSESPDDCVYVSSPKWCCCVYCYSACRDYSCYSWLSQIVCNMFPWNYECTYCLVECNCLRGQTGGECTNCARLCLIGGYDSSLSCCTGPWRCSGFANFCNCEMCYAGYTTICDGRNPSNWTCYYDSCRNSLVARSCVMTALVNSNTGCYPSGYCHYVYDNPNGVRVNGCTLLEECDVCSFDKDKYQCYIEERGGCTYRLQSCCYVFSTALCARICQYLLLDHICMRWARNGSWCNVLEYSASLPVVRRWTCTYCVDETRVCFRDYSSCHWSIYMEYI